MAKISVVSPVYRAEGCVEELVRRLSDTLSAISEDYEIILVEDRSPDDSWGVITRLAKADSRVRGVRLARNFGQHYAITAGLDMAAGDWVVVMDCDLQDPPEKIADLYEEALKGNEVVLAHFQERTESPFRKALSRLFWRGLSWLAGIDFDPRVGNFRIMSRRVVENFRDYREQLRFLGGIVSLMGFTTSSVSMKRDSRFEGESSYTFSKLAALAANIILAYSDKPLRISIQLGLIMAVTAFIAGAAFIFLEAADVVQVPGWTSVMVSVYLIGGIIIANLGLIGYYLSRTFDEVKRRPLYIVERTTMDETSKD